MPLPPPRVFAYCHDSVGIGHLARTTAICRRVGAEFPGSSFLIATGTPYVSLFESLAKSDYIKLPALAKLNGNTYHSKHLEFATEELMKCRRSMLRDTIEFFAPSILLVDKAPLGVCGELIPAIEWLRTHRPDTRIIFGMRDIEDDAQTTIEEWERAGIPTMLEECFDEIWVYGMRSVFDVASEYKFSECIQSKMSYMGYVSREPCHHDTKSPERSKNVLVTVGGGTDGEALLTTYLDVTAQRLSDNGMGSTIIGGPDLPEAISRKLRRRASRIPGVSWKDFDACMDCRIRDADLVVSMGGYNTLCQIVRNQRPALVVPRTSPRVEQAIRAKLWAQRGLIHVADGDTLTPESLAERVHSLVENCPRPTPFALDFGGLERITERFAAFWNAETPHAASVRL